METGWPISSLAAAARDAHRTADVDKRGRCLPCRLAGSLQIFQPLLLIQFQQRIDHRIEVAGQDGFEVEIFLSAAFSAEAVIGAAALRKAASADPLVAVAGSWAGVKGEASWRTGLRMPARTKAIR